MKEIFKKLLLSMLMFIALNLFLGQTSDFEVAAIKNTANTTNINFESLQLQKTQKAISFDSLLGIGHARASSLSDDLKAGGSQPWVTAVWDFCLSLINIALIGVLIFLAVVNILHIQYETYQLKKILLPMIIFVLLANFSLFFSRVIVELGNALSNTFFQQANDISHGLLNGLFLGSLQSGAIGLMEALPGNWGTAGGIIMIILYTVLGIIICIILFLIFLVLAVIMYVRAFVILALAAVSPLAYAAAILSQTQGFFRQWWTWFLRWVFMGPLILLVLKIASIIGDTTTGSTTINPIFTFIAIIGMMILAIMVPWIIGGQVLGKIPGLKNLPGAAGKAIGNFASTDIPGVSKIYQAGVGKFKDMEAKGEAKRAGMQAYGRGLFGGGMGLGAGAERDFELQNQANTDANNLLATPGNENKVWDAKELKKFKNPYMAGSIASAQAKNGNLKQNQLTEIDKYATGLKKGQKQKFEQIVEQAIEVNRKYHVAKGQIPENLKSPFDNPGELGAAENDIKSYKGGKYDATARKTLAERSVTNLDTANRKINLSDLNKTENRQAANRTAKAFDELSNAPEAVKHANYKDLEKDYKIDTTKFNAGTEAIAKSATVKANQHHVERMINSNVDVGKLSKFELQEYKKAHNALKEKMTALKVDATNHSNVVAFMKGGGIAGDKRAQAYAHNFINNADNLNRPDIINRILKRK